MPGRIGKKAKNDNWKTHTHTRTLLPASLQTVSLNCVPADHRLSILRSSWPRHSSKGPLTLLVPLSRAAYTSNTTTPPLTATNNGTFSAGNLHHISHRRWLSSSTRFRRAPWLCWCVWRGKNEFMILLFNFLTLVLAIDYFDGARKTFRFAYASPPVLLSLVWRLVRSKL